MRLLLDTHALIWCMENNRKLGPRTRDMLTDPVNDVLVSIGSLWEIVVKVRAGKLIADAAKIARLVGQNGFRWLELRQQHLVVLADLPFHRRDPFDHLLIAQAIAESATLVTVDRDIARYPVEIVTCSQ